MKIGDKVNYNRKEVVVILAIEGRHALVQFQSGTKIATPLYGLWPR